jgi:hypothetical protein
MTIIDKIEHHSPSALNLFAADISMYVLERILGQRQPVGAPAHRGSAVEEGVAYGLEQLEAPVEECVTIALSRYDTLMALSADPRRDAYRKDIPEMIEQAVTHLRPYGAPSGTQGFVEWRPEGLALPIIGFSDFVWDDKGILLDLKTTAKMPSEIRVGHARQVSLYATSDNMDARLCYVTPRKIACYHLENIAEHRNALHRIAQRVEKFLSLSDDPEYYLSITAPNLDSFYWAGPEARALAYKYWRI